MIEKSLEILQLTQDGNTLEPGHLSLVQAAVNGHLTKTGEERFLRLHEQVIAGNYTKPWLCAVEHVTRDHANYVYWKGVQIEHFSMHVMKPGELDECTRHLAEICKHIESLGLPVSRHSYFNDWLREMPADFPAPFKQLLYELPHLYEHPDGTAAFVISGLHEDGWPLEARFLKVSHGTAKREKVQLGSGCVEYHAMTALGYELARCGQPPQQGPAAAKLDGVMAWLRRMSITAEIAAELIDLNHLNEVEVSELQSASRQLAA